MKKKLAIILAAGKGSRMKSKKDNLSKVSYPILGQPLVKYVINALKPLNIEKTVAVIGFGGETALPIVEKDCLVAWQHEQKGAGHAVMMTAPLLGNDDGYTIICCGDTPLLTSETIDRMFKEHIENGNDLTVMTFYIDNPFGYGRIVKDGDAFVRIVEQRDTNEETAKIKEVNAGVYIFDNRELFESLSHLGTNNAAGEYYLTDVIELFVKKGLKAGTYQVKDNSETLGVNDRVQLSEAARILKSRINKNHMLNGVTIEDPDNTYIGPNVTIGPDTVIRPGCYIMGETAIGEDNLIGPNATIVDSEIGSRNRIGSQKLMEATIGDNQDI